MDSEYLEYGPMAFLFWDDIGRMAWQDRSDLAIWLEKRAIARGNSPEYQALKKRRATSNG